MEPPEGFKSIVLHVFDENIGPIYLLNEVIIDDVLVDHSVKRIKKRLFKMEDMEVEEKEINYGASPSSNVDDDQ